MGETESTDSRKRATKVKELQEIYGAKLRRYLVRRFGNPADADEIHQGAELSESIREHSVRLSGFC